MFPNPPSTRGHELFSILALSIIPSKNHTSFACVSAREIRFYHFSTSRKSQHPKLVILLNALLQSFTVTVNHETIAMVDPAAMRRVQAASKRLELALQGRSTGPPPNIPQSMVQKAFLPMITESRKVLKEEQLKEDQVRTAHPINMNVIN